MIFPDFDELIRLGASAPRLRLAAGKKTADAAAGGHASPFRGQGLSFHEVREYRTGDDIRRIDWRVTARTRKPHLKIFTEERERTVLLAIDANAAMRFGTRGTFKSVQAARAAALLGHRALGEGDKLGCVVFGDVKDGLRFFTPERSGRALWQALKLLSGGKTGLRDKPVAVEEVLQYLDRAAPTGALLFIISDFYPLSEDFEKYLGNLRRNHQSGGRDVVLVGVSDPADAALPPVETVIFSDAGGEKSRVNTDSLAGRAAYARQWEENRARLETAAGRQRAGIVDLHTDGRVYNDLLRGLRRLNFGRTA